MTSRLATARRLGRITLVTALVALIGAVGGTTLAAPAAQAAPSATGEFDYAEALQDSMLFYEAQRSGHLPSDNRVSWRGDSDLSDGADHGIDLTGGYHDAGDEVKFGLPLAYSLATLAWGGIADQAGYTASGQMTYLLRNLRWGDDYIIKAHPSAHVFYAQAGDGDTDHTFWGPAEVNPTNRPSSAVTEACPGSDVVGESAAALAASSILFTSSDSAYAATLLAQAKSLYEFADDYRGTYDQCIPGVTNFYRSWSGYWDELTWGAIWLYKATGDSTYLTKARTDFANLGKAQDGTPKYNYTISWDDTTFGIYILMAEITGEQQYVTDAERNLDWLTTGYNGSRVTYTPGGEAQVDTWGPARYSADAAFTALEFSGWLKRQNLDPTRQVTYHSFGVQQINYILGDNPNHESYEVGFTNGGTSTKWPMFVHNRTAHGSWDQSMTDPPYTRHTEYGLLVGGPTSGTDTFDDNRQDYQQTEGALDYNALFSGALAELTSEYGGTPRASFPTETPDGPEMYTAASVNQAGTNFIEIKSQVYNKSGWPARALTHGTLRYYFTLDPGVSASQLALTAPYAQCPNPLSVHQFNGSVWYLQVDCTGQVIAPAGQSQWHRENQFRITFPAAHDYTKDWSYAGVGAQGTDPVTVNDIVLYDGGTKVWGNEPTTGPVTPPGAPGTPVASAITSSSATLTWAAATAGSSPVAGYDVYRVGSPDTVVASTTGALTTAVTGLSPSTAYTFYVVARDSSGVTGAHSGTVAVTTPAGPVVTPPGAPGKPTASAVTATSVTLTWTAAVAGTNPVAAYDVYRVGSPDTVVASTTGALTATVSGLAASTAYTFYVKARDGGGVTGSASASTAVTTATAPAGGCKVGYAVSDWGSGFTATITITNTGTATINGWTLAFAYAGNQTVTNGWSATWTQSGHTVTAVSMSYNGTLTSGASTQVGFNASYSGANAAPTAFTVNGSACTIG